VVGLAALAALIPLRRPLLILMIPENNTIH
jgi:hypothetical protein